MPTYDYQCRSCGVITEVVHPMTEDGPSACPACGGALRRILHPAGIIFKGSGFYKTDSRRSKAGAASSSPSGSAGDASSTTSAAPAASGDGSTTKGSAASD